MKHSQSELRGVNKLIKLDYDNIELISQKHKLLGQAYKKRRTIKKKEAKRNRKSLQKYR